MKERVKSNKYNTRMKMQIYYTYVHIHLTLSRENNDPADNKGSSFLM